MIWCFKNSKIEMNWTPSGFFLEAAQSRNETQIIYSSNELTKAIGWAQVTWLSQ